MNVRPLILGLLLSNYSFSSEPIKVAVVDTGLDLSDSRFTSVICPKGHADFTSEGIKDTIGHGTHVAGLIKKYAEKSQYCLLILKYYTAAKEGNFDRFVSAFRWAIYQGANIINVSGGGSAFNEPEYLLIRDNPKVIIVAAAGNEGKENYSWYPATYPFPNVIAVGALRQDGGILASSNRGYLVQSMELGENVISTLPNGAEGKMSGTSMACAIKTGKLIKEMSNETHH